ncbi:uncharacterized protein LOC144435413 [Glandiceps talaboti]
MMTARWYFTYFTLLYMGISIATSQNEKLLLADITTNKLTRVHDGTWGMWSYHGIASASHANQTEFIYNADLLSKYGHHHPSIASVVYPNMGLTSDMDPVYQEYLILQAKAAKIDGFLVEWGYKGHSSDNALQSLIPLVKKHFPFKIGVNWCDHWLKMAMTNHTNSTEFIAVFHDNVQYLVDTLYSLGAGHTLIHKKSPLIFLFGDGITSKQFQDVLSRPLTLPTGMTSPVWLGNYLNFASTSTLWSKWRDLLNGTYGWVPARLRPTTSADMKHWDFYATLQDVVTYQANISKFGEECVKSKTCITWCATVSPGFDNRGCAGWGGTLKYLPRKDLEKHKKLLYNAQWNYINQTETNIVVIATMNDFPEATPILGVDGDNEMLYRTEYWSSQWKCVKSQPVVIELPIVWFRYMKILQFYNQTRGLVVSDVLKTMDTISLLLSHGDYSLAEGILSNVIKAKIKEIENAVEVTNLTVRVPSRDMYTVYDTVVVNGSYYINHTVGLYVQMNDSIATTLQHENFKGYLEFQYKLLADNFTNLYVYSSSKRHQPGTEYYVLPRYDNLHVNLERKSHFGDFSEVCNIMVKKPGIWQSARVQLYKQNQSWDHSGHHGADIYFITKETPFLISNLNLSFEMYTMK